MSTSSEQWLTPAQYRQRAIATALALVLFAGVLILLYVFWWRPWSIQRDRLQSLQERRARVEAVLNSRPAIETALRGAELAANRDPLLFPEPTRDQAIAGMMQRIQERVTSIGDEGKHCRIDSQNPVTANQTADPQRIAVNLRLHCGNSEWLQFAQAVESARPAMFIDELNITAPSEQSNGMSSAQQGALDIGLTVYGFLRNAEPKVDVRP